jgi:hypothetical protein
MAVVPASHRIDTWEAKMTGDVISANAVKVLVVMKHEINAKFPLLVDLEESVKVILGEEGIDVYQNIVYINAGREMWRKHNRFSGAQLIYECNIVLQKYQARGCTQIILERIRDVVISLPSP